jgi:DNA polymerase-3 subunit delta
LIVVSQVDRRTALYRRFQEKGTVLDLELERDRSGKPSRETLGAFLDRAIRETGKEIEPRAREAILDRAGEELWALHQELEKLLLYVDDERKIRSEHVEEVCLQLGDDWVFDLTRAIAERDTLRALGHLQNLLSQGEAPLKLLALVANEVRRLLAARQLLEGDLVARWRSRMTFPEFQRIVQQGQPLLTRNPYGDYLTLQRAEPFTTAELVGDLERIYQTDQRLKSSGGATRVALERLIVDLCGARKRRISQDDQRL